MKSLANSIIAEDAIQENQQLKQVTEDYCSLQITETQTKLSKGMWR